MTDMPKPDRFSRHFDRHGPGASLTHAQEKLAARPPMRRFDIKWLDATGAIKETSKIGPAHPVFEDAFSAFARGSMVATETGPVAVEDLLPGDKILTETGPALPLVWHGSMTCNPGLSLPTGHSIALNRISPDSFGLTRPEQVLVTGPGARLARHLPNARDLSGVQYALTRVSALQDGYQVVETVPPSAVQLFHLCLPRHAIIRVCGLGFETYHPGRTLPFANTGLRAAFLGMFPNVRHLSDFGPMAGVRAEESNQDQSEAPAPPGSALRPIG